MFPKSKMTGGGFTDAAASPRDEHDFSCQLLCHGLPSSSPQTGSVKKVSRPHQRHASKPTLRLPSSASQRLCKGRLVRKNRFAPCRKMGPDTVFFPQDLPLGFARFRWKYLKLLERVWSFVRCFSDETS